MLYLGLIPMTFILDQRLKDGIEMQDADDLPQNMWKDRLTLTRAHNKGMMMSAMEDKPELVTKLHIVFTILLAIWYIPTLFKKGEGAKKLGGALLLSGTLSNLYDRRRHGYVIDYVKINIWPLNKMIVNLADVFITIGSFFAAIHLLTRKD